MKTSFLLMAQYDGLALIPVEWVCRDYFRHHRCTSSIVSGLYLGIERPLNWRGND